ncbi:MAG: polysaccharide pyruvyl transferase family protein, partial [Ruminococcus sp.]|nr:polysaccharide pyruvyl transferase family protein [Ruminococcus sp.]
IYDILYPLLRNDKTIITDLPYHGNVGDILIWEGELQFLKSINAYPISQTSNSTFFFPTLDEDITICLHGGGNFGDLYYEAQQFRHKVIERYPNNKIIIFPQSVWYDDVTLINKDISIFSKHRNLHICARDSSSYSILKNHFEFNNIYLVPDMAFCITNLNKYSKFNCKDKQRALYIERLDKEQVKNTYFIDEPYDKRDWLIFEGKSNFNRIFFGLIRRLKNVENEKLRSFLARIIDNIMQRYIKNTLIRQGVKLLEPYKKIYTTRLHAMILGILLNKKVTAFDNTTKKLTTFYHTWLRSDHSVKLKNI